MSSKKRDFLSFALFFIGIWSIPFWCPFIIQSILEIFLWIFGFNYNLDILGKFLVWLYCGLSLFVGYAVREENEWYLQMFSTLSYIIAPLTAFLMLR